MFTIAPQVVLNRENDKPEQILTRISNNISLSCPLDSKQRLQFVGQNGADVARVEVFEANVRLDMVNAQHSSAGLYACMDAENRTVRRWNVSVLGEMKKNSAL